MFFIIVFSKGQIFHISYIFSKNIIFHSTVYKMFGWELSEDTEERQVDRSHEKRGSLRKMHLLTGKGTHVSPTETSICFGLEVESSHCYFQATEVQASCLAALWFDVYVCEMQSGMAHPDSSSSLHS